MNRTAASRKPPRPEAAAFAGALAAALAASFLAASCAAPLRIQASLDPLALLSKDRLAYVRVSGGVARDLAPALLRPDRLGQARGLLDRSRVIALGLGRAPVLDGSAAPDEAAAGGSAAAQAGPGRAAASPNVSSSGLEAALVGDFPFRAASLSLGANREWKREKEGYYNERLGIRAAVPGPNLAVAAQGSIDGLLAAAMASAESAPPSPIPRRLDALASRELVLWVPDPFRALAAKAAGDGMDVPARGLLVAASPDPAAKGDYLATVAFLMDGPDAVRIFKPVLRLGWYALSSAAFGPDAGPVAKPSFEAEGELYVADGIRLTRESLVFALGRAFGRLGEIDGESGAGIGSRVGADR